MGFKNERKGLFPMQKGDRVVLADKDCEEAMLDAGYVHAPKGTRPSIIAGPPVTAGGKEDEADQLRANLNALTKPVLIELLEANGFDTSGRKADLVERCVEAGLEPESYNNDGGDDEDDEQD